MQKPSWAIASDRRRIGASLSKKATAGKVLSRSLAALHKWGPFR
jgi:hypothetical protein